MANEKQIQNPLNFKVIWNDKFLVLLHINARTEICIRGHLIAVQKP